MVFVPLVLIAFRVNQITSFTKATFNSILGENKSTDTIEDIEEDDDSDEETLKDDDDDDDSGKVGISAEDTDDGFSDGDTYAPIFGRWKFHTRIPILRRLWKRRIYLDTKDDDDFYLNDEGFDMDYPLHHFFSVISPLKLVPSWFWRKRYIGYDEDESIPSTTTYFRDRTTVVGKIIQHVPFASRRRIRRRGSDGDDITEEESANYSRSRATRVIEPIERIFQRWNRARDRDETEITSDERRPADRESSSTSGSERHVSRFGAAFPEPLRRLFVRRRRSPDVESLASD